MLYERPSLPHLPGGVTRAAPPVRGNAPRIGVLSLQGDVREHVAALYDSGAAPQQVRRRTELEGLDGLVIPGGESTAISHLLRDLGMLEPLHAFLGDGMPAFGSCAGMIMLADEIVDAGVPGREALPLHGIDMTVRRNAFGRQVDSFERDLPFDGFREPVRAVFIRAPWVERVGAGVTVLSRDGDHIVAVRQGRVLATAFHSEITADRRVHGLFVDIVTGDA